MLWKLDVERKQRGLACRLGTVRMKEYETRPVSSPLEPTPPLSSSLSRAISKFHFPRVSDPVLLAPLTWASLNPFPTSYLLSPFSTISIVESPLSIYQFTWHHPYLDACEECPLGVRLTTPRRNFWASETGREGAWRERRYHLTRDPLLSLSASCAPAHGGGETVGNFQAAGCLNFFVHRSTGIMHRDVHNAFLRHTNEVGEDLVTGRKYSEWAWYSSLFLLVNGNLPADRQA